MAEPEDVQALEKISTEVDESQIKFILSTQCIKAQAFLVDKLKKQSERRKETCGFLSSANLKLESEIKQAEREIKNLLISNETIKLGNIELKKEWLLAKEQKLDIIERVKNGEKKYEELWLESKSRYESIPYVQIFLQANDRAQTFKEQITLLKNQADNLVQEIDVQKDVYHNLDRKRIVELAEFIVHEMPNTIELFHEKTIQANNLTKDIEEILKDKEANANIVTDANELFMDKQEEEIIHVNTAFDGDDDNLIMPKLELVNIDLDILSVKLDQIKKNESMHNTPEKRETSAISYFEIDTGQSYRQEEEVIEYISSYFKKPSLDGEYTDTQNYSKKKLINILEDIQVNQNDAYNMVSNVEVDKLQAVNVIGMEVTSTDTSKCYLNKGNRPVISNEIEEIDLRSTNMESIVIPPSQFLDVTLGRANVIVENLPSSHENAHFSQSKNNQVGLCKKVLFDLPNTLQIHDILETGDKAENDGNDTTNSQLDASGISDDRFMKIKDMILKKHNLDLSPQFIYAKNVMVQMKHDDKYVTSKFFKNNEQAEDENYNEHNECRLPDDRHMEVDEIKQFRNEQIQHVQQPNNCDKDEMIEMEVDQMVVCSPKKQKTDEFQKSDKPMSGFLFTHGSNVIPDSLNISISTTGYEDSNADFPHCIDSSLLLSPKADLPMPISSEHPEVLSQEVPNFLSGLRKTGLSFFSGMTSSESKPDSSAQNQGSFSFNFGGEEKKNRGGLFSMFQ